MLLKADPSWIPEHLRPPEKEELPINGKVQSEDDDIEKEDWPSTNSKQNGHIDIKGVHYLTTGDVTNEPEVEILMKEPIV